MTFQELKHFLQEKMSMSHIYQPLLIKILVDSGGYATVRHLALQFLGYDESQLLYYEKGRLERGNPSLLDLAPDGLDREIGILFPGSSGSLSGCGRHLKVGQVLAGLRRFGWNGCW